MPASIYVLARGVLYLAFFVISLYGIWLFQKSPPQHPDVMNATNAIIFATSCLNIRGYRYEISRTITALPVGEARCAAILACIPALTITFQSYWVYYNVPSILVQLHPDLQQSSLGPMMSWAALVVFLVIVISLWQDVNARFGHARRMEAEEEKNLRHRNPKENDYRAVGRMGRREG